METYLEAREITGEVAPSQRVTFIGTTEWVLPSVPNKAEFVKVKIDGYIATLVDSIKQKIDETFNTSCIGNPVFGGGILDDLNSGGAFTGLIKVYFKVVIDSIGVTDTFKWSDTNGATWNATLVPITGLAQILSNGVTITFTNLTGHALEDNWFFTGCPVKNYTFKRHTCYMKDGTGQTCIIVDEAKYVGGGGY